MLLGERLRYVAAIPKPLRGRLSNLSKLYAYPTEPEDVTGDNIRILDSGAYGLSKRGRSIDMNHMRGLAAHYAAHQSPQTLCVAPDVFLNPDATLSNMRMWRDNFAVDVCPVVQFTSTQKLDLRAVEKQCTAYAGNRVWFISNPSMRGRLAKAQGFEQVLRMCREAGARYIHILGAGWDGKDVIEWGNIYGFDSMDTVAYYTAAKQGESWDGRDYHSWADRAEANAVYGQQIFERIHEARSGIIQ